jgi:hypothetical protein
MTTPAEDGARFVRWLEGEVIADGRGDRLTDTPTRPADRLWLGRLAPEETAWKVGKGARAQRLDPCSMGMTFRPEDWEWRIEVSLVVWTRKGEKDQVRWRKSDRVHVVVEPGELSPDMLGTFSYGERDFASAFAKQTIGDRAARIDVEIAHDHGNPTATVLVVNETTEKKTFDANLYEVVIRVRSGRRAPILLDALPDSFRYDRRISAYGVNAGVVDDGEWLESTDAVIAERRRPEYWDAVLGQQPDLSFVTLARDPMPPLGELIDALKRWGDEHWSEKRLADRAAADGWNDEMQEEASREAARFRDEVGRAQAGLDRLDDAIALRAFRLMNEAFEHSGVHGRYTSWRPFQVGFLLSVLPSLLRDDDERRRVVDTLWFATGGGKTETYLAAVIFSCIVDRLRGKHYGITAWSRFPLRMLSLQQTQRFADALAGAELARQRDQVEGGPFALGFLVGGPPAGTPNRIRDDATGIGTDTRTLVPENHRVLLHCPFCFSDQLEMHFDRRSWRLEHRCTSEDCPWTLEKGLPFHIVDDEIYRFLPSAVVGTLDKAASVAIQAAQRGLYASPIARCARDGHGFTYAPRKSSPNGCQVPGCKEPVTALGQEIPLFAPTLRIQDELHLLRDSLGAVDSNYETLLDHLQRRTKSPSAKIIASSATLSGYEHQVNVLYDRKGSVFPLPGPAPGASFWTKDSDALARRYVGLAPRGQTLEFANDRLAESLQQAVRRLITEPQIVCTEAGIDPSHADALLDQYGTHVCYGTKLADVDAAARSFETQPGVSPLNVERLTGATELEKVREVLARLGSPEPEFSERIHVICASSMMSHGVDVDRFNVITLLGIPLATAEFIQTSARIGRRHPGLAFVLHRMGVERDSSVFRSFAPYVEQGDRFIEPIAITRRSRRVLEHTYPGMFSARVHGIHEAKRVRGEGKSISIARDLRAYAASAPVLEEDEFAELCDALGLDSNGTAPLEEELRHQLRLTFQEINNPASRAFFISELLPAPPMRSLREVETQIEIHSKDER